MHYLTSNRATNNWFAHALALTSFSVHRSSQNLCQSTFLLIMQLMHNAMRKLQVWNQLLVICLYTPPRPTWGHSVPFFNQAPRPPPFNQTTQQGCQSTGLELWLQNILYFVKVAQKNSGDPLENFQNRPIKTNPPPPPKWLIYISINRASASLFVGEENARQPAKVFIYNLW